MNDLARESFSKGKLPYAPGAVIIKEKLFLDYNPDGDNISEQRKDGVGGMVKRKVGYDPENNDWEYFYFESPDAIEAGRIENCIECHTQTRNTDYVFGTWNDAEHQF